MPKDVVEVEKESFYRGVREIFDSLVKEKVDAVIFPLRGAEIIARCLKLLYELEGAKKRGSDEPAVRQPEFIFLKIGEFDKKGSRKLRPEGIMAQIRGGIDSSQAAKLGAPVYALVDEAISGGSISLNSKRIGNHLRRRQPNAKLLVYALKQTQIKTHVAPLYQKNVDRGVITPVYVERVFFSDNPQLLHPLELNETGSTHVKRGGSTFERLGIYTDFQLRARELRGTRERVSKV